jgi:hypothetical protein
MGGHESIAAWLAGRRARLVRLPLRSRRCRQGLGMMTYPVAPVGPGEPDTRSLTSHHATMPRPWVSFPSLILSTCTPGEGIGLQHSGVRVRTGAQRHSLGHRLGVPVTRTVTTTGANDPR